MLILKKHEAINTDSYGYFDVYGVDGRWYVTAYSADSNMSKLLYCGGDENKAKDVYDSVINGIIDGCSFIRLT